MHSPQTEAETLSPMTAEQLAVLADDIADMANDFYTARDPISLRNMGTNLARMIRIHVTATQVQLTIALRERDEWKAHARKIHDDKWDALMDKIESAERERDEAIKRVDLFKNQLTVQEQRTGEWHRACESAERARDEADGDRLLLEAETFNLRTGLEAAERERNEARARIVELEEAAGAGLQEHRRQMNKSHDQT